MIKFFLIRRLCWLILGLQNRPLYQQCLASSKSCSTKSASARETLKRSSTIRPEMSIVALSVYYFLFHLLGCFDSRKSTGEITIIDLIVIHVTKVNSTEALLLNFFQQFRHLSYKTNNRDFQNIYNERKQIKSHPYVCVYIPCNVPKTLFHNYTVQCPCGRLRKSDFR